MNEKFTNPLDLNHRRNQRGRINRREIRVISLPVGWSVGSRNPKGWREREWRGLVKRCKNVIYRFRSACDERQCVPVGGWTRATLFSGLSRNGGEKKRKKEKKREWKNVSAVIRIIRFTASHLRFVPTATTEGWKSDPGRYFVRLFSHFFQLARRKATSRFSFSVRCFARETSEIHRLLSMKFDLELRGNYFLSFLFRNDFPTGFKTVLFPFENKRNLRKGSICLIDIRFCEISQKYRIQIFNRGNLSKSSFLRNR